MTEKNNKEIILGVIFVVLLGLYLDPFGKFMPSMMEMLMMLALVVLFTVYAGFVWRENHGDEREVLHRGLAGRIAYLVGTAVLLLGIIVQGLNHQTDIWLVVSLGLMIVTKIISIIYLKSKN